jgi:FSR family fosmidomycin resistance protein-like MFS transporter
MTTHGNRNNALAVYGITHAIVDAGCAAIAASLSRTYPLTLQTCMQMVVIYNMTAFGMQALLGFFVDLTGLRRPAAITGATLVAVAVISCRVNWQVAISLAALGNALFHVGAGALTLRMAPGRAWPCGIFVAPGVLGLFVGSMVSRMPIPFPADVMVPFLVLSILCMLIFAADFSPGKDRPHVAAVTSSVGILGLLLLTIAIRAYIGLTIGIPWKSDTVALAMLAAAAVIGKAAGGLLSDRYGWRRLSVGALIAVVPMVVLAPGNQVLAVVGMVCIQMTMPVSLAAIAATMPDRPGFAFGISCVALVAGALPVLVWSEMAVVSPHQSALLVIAAVGAVFIGLRQFTRQSAKVSLTDDYKTEMPRGVVSGSPILS